MNRASCRSCRPCTAQSTASRRPPATRKNAIASSAHAQRPPFVRSHSPHQDRNGQFSGHTIVVFLHLLEGVAVSGGLPALVREIVGQELENHIVLCDAKQRQQCALLVQGLSHPSIIHPSNQPSRSHGRQQRPASTNPQHIPSTSWRNRAAISWLQTAPWQCFPPLWPVKTSRTAPPRFRSNRCPSPEIACGPTKPTYRLRGVPQPVAHSERARRGPVRLWRDHLVHKLFLSPVAHIPSSPHCQDRVVGDRQTRRTDARTWLAEWKAQAISAQLSAGIGWPRLRVNDCT